MAKIEKENEESGNFEELGPEFGPMEAHGSRPTVPCSFPARAEPRRVEPPSRVVPAICHASQPTPVHLTGSPVVVAS